MGLGPLHCVANEDDAAASTGDGALDEQQALLEVDRVNLEVQHGHAVATHAAGHAHALEDSLGVEDAPIEPGLRWLRCEPWLDERP